MEKKYLSIMFGLLILVLITSCSAVSVADIELDQEAKSFKEFPDKALVYIVRPSSLGTSVKMKVYANDKYVGSTGGSRFLYAILDPGKYVFRSEAENDSEVIIKAEASKIYYIEQEVNMGLFLARNELVLLDEKEGRIALLDCSLSATNVFNTLSSKTK